MAITQSSTLSYHPCSVNLEPFSINHKSHSGIQCNKESSCLGRYIHIKIDLIQLLLHSHPATIPGYLADSELSDDIFIIDLLVLATMLLNFIRNFQWTYFDISQSKGTHHGVQVRSIELGFSQDILGGLARREISLGVFNALGSHGCCGSHFDDG